MNTKRCCFAGHNKKYGSEERERVKERAEFVIKEYGVKEFWAGNYGGFDRMCAGVIRELKSSYNKIKVFMVIPYLTKEMERNIKYYKERYDDILIADLPLKTPYKFRIIKTNEYMINNCKYLICNIEHLWGGAAQTFEYAAKKGTNIFNIQNG